MRDPDCPIEYRKSLLRERVEKEMEQTHLEVMEKLEAMFHPQIIKEITELLIYGYSEGLDSANIIAEKLGLAKKHFLSLMWDDPYYDEDHIFGLYSEEFLSDHEYDGIDL